MRPATIASMEVDSLKPARLLVVALLTFVLTVSASVAVAASRVALVVGNGTYAHRPPPAAGFGVTVARAAQDPSAVEAELGLDRPTRRLIQQGLRNGGFDAGTPDGLFGPRTRAAIRAWQAAREQAETGYLDGVQAAALRAGGVTASSGGQRPGGWNGPSGRLTRCFGAPSRDSCSATGCERVGRASGRRITPGAGRGSDQS